MKRLNIFIVLIITVLGCSEHNRNNLCVEITNLDIVKNQSVSITSHQLIKDVQASLKSYLPNTIKISDTIYVDFIKYSNRGSYANNDSIIIDISDLDTITDLRIKNIVAHEMHHILYMNWLLKTVRNRPQNDNQLVLSWWQYRIIHEGIAQQINFTDYPEPIRMLYQNEVLLTELLDFWISNQRNIVKSSNPKQVYSEIQNYMWNEWSIEKLKLYLSESEKFSPHRPTVEYYLGYHFYKIINDELGSDGLMKVINNPKYLLRIYNETIDKKNLSLPQDIVELWKINYKENTATNTR